MLRLRFHKTSNAVWISHLDTMRLFQRAFKRCGYHLKHTQGFNPRPSVSIALPLSVGVESFCELLDFELDDLNISLSDIKDKLNINLIDGVTVTDVYDQGNKIKNLKYLHCQVDLHYDQGISVSAETAINELFARSELWLDKKSKNGIISQNIIPMVRQIRVERSNDRLVRINAVICCQEPSLNPTQLSSAVIKYLPEYTPNFVNCRRLEVLDGENQVFK